MRCRKSQPATAAPNDDTPEQWLVKRKIGFGPNLMVFEAPSGTLGRRGLRASIMARGRCPQMLYGRLRALPSPAFSASLSARRLPERGLHPGSRREAVRRFATLSDIVRRAAIPPPSAAHMRVDLRMRRSCPCALLLRPALPWAIAPAPYMNFPPTPTPMPPTPRALAEPMRCGGDPLGTSRLRPRTT